MSTDTTFAQQASLNGKTPVATHTVYLGLGSNLGDRRGNLAAALQRLREVIEITSVSSVYDTEPVGFADQPRFLNIVLRGQTALDPEALLGYVKQIEAKLGRQPSFRYGPRPIDIDILLYDDLHIEQDNLTIPHPRMGERAFVLVPLAEIAPESVEPVSGKTAQELLEAVLQAGVHMSRFSDALDEVMEEMGQKSWPKIELLAEHIARTIVEKQQALRAEAHIRTAYPLQKWTPVSGRPTQEVYGLLAEAVATKEGSRRMVGVEVEGMVACPCAQDMVHAYAQLRLQEEGFPDDVIAHMLAVTPLATHNQRGRATLMIGTDQDLDVRDLVDLAESAMSSENYGLLKRPDELYIVNQAHANPRFVEDVAREMLRAVVEKYSDLLDDTFVWVHQRNEETIHKYDVEAEGWGTLGELRAEILRSESLERHTNKEEWLLQHPLNSLD